jgi:hypothetical protein
VQGSIHAESVYVMTGSYGYFSRVLLFNCRLFFITELFFNGGKHKYQNKITEVLLDPSKDTGVEVSADNTKSCCLTTRTHDKIVTESYLIYYLKMRQNKNIWK